MLEIEDPALDTTPSGEVDLFLVKQEASSDTVQKNIVIEIKRPSITLNKACYDQIDSYRTKIMQQSLCNGTNQHWEFYLIGSEIDSHISELIESAKNHGEQKKGLTKFLLDGRAKVYVRKWSDFLEVEWNSKMKYLKEKLELKAKQADYSSPDEMVKNITNQN